MADSSKKDLVCDAVREYPEALKFARRDLFPCLAFILSPCIYPQLLGMLAGEACWHVQMIGPSTSPMLKWCLLPLTPTSPA